MYRLFIDESTEPVSVKAFHTPRVGDHLNLIHGTTKTPTRALVVDVVHDVDLAQADGDEAFQRELVDVYVSSES